jgi:hypothetical protein
MFDTSVIQWTQDASEMDISVYFDTIVSCNKKIKIQLTLIQYYYSPEKGFLKLKNLKSWNVNF